MEALLTASPWFPTAAGVLIFLLDAWLSLLERYHYYAGGGDFISIPAVFPRLPNFQPSRGPLGLLDRREVLFVAGAAVGIPLAWWVLVRLNDLAWVFTFSLGGLLLFEAAECIRLGRSITLLRGARSGEGIRGGVEVARWLFWNVHVVDLYGFAVLYLVLFAVTSQLFFVGGAAACFLRAHATRDVSIYMRWLKKKGR